MNELPKISVVTCTWNSEPYLAESIASVLSQDYPNYEYIFVDGGSTDGTLERIRALNRPYVLLENVRGGISRAMNAGIRAASGDIVTHLHSDDYYLSPTVLRRVASAFQSSSREWLTGWIVNDYDGRHIEMTDRAVTFSMNSVLGGRLFIPHPATFIKRSLFDRVGLFDESLRYAMDIDLWLRIASDGAQPIEISDRLCAFRKHSGSCTTANQWASMREAYMVRSKYALRHPLVFAGYSMRFLYNLVLSRLRSAFTARKK